MTTPGVFIAGTDTGVGKTRVTVALLTALRQAGVHAGGMKPVAAGVDAAGCNEDVTRILAASSLHDGASARAIDVSPYCLDWAVSPHLAARRAGVRIELSRIRSAYERFAMRCDLVIVEGTGGWLAPITEELTMADVAGTLALPVLLVVGLKLGCLNHALLTAQGLAAAHAPCVGWIGSVVDPQMQALQENIDTLEQRLGAPPLGLLPHARERTQDGPQLLPAAQALLRALRSPSPLRPLRPLRC